MGENESMKELVQTDFTVEKGAESVAQAVDAKVPMDSATVIDNLLGERNLLSKQLDELRLDAEKHKAFTESVVLTRENLEYQPYIDGPPVPQGKETLYKQACSADGVTIDSWFDTWINHITENNKVYDFKALSVEQELAKFAYMPCIVAGSGPSLRVNAKYLKERGNIPLVSCLHNFGYFEDLGCPADYYMNLDAGPITIEEMSQGGTQSPEHYWETTKDRTLVTAITGNPELLKKWKGKILFFSVVAPAKKFTDAVSEITDFHIHFSVGGNTLGACLYMAKAILGCNPIAYIGADFCFGHNHKFHSWDSPYDKQYSGLTPAIDVFGLPVKTWASYYNFKCWFEYIACGGSGNQPGDYVNCTEGGILGAYREGNIKQIRQVPLAMFLWPYTLHKKQSELLKSKETFQFLF